MLQALTLSTQVYFVPTKTAYSVAKPCAIAKDKLLSNDILVHVTAVFFKVILP